jgi:hypothetical protein
MVVTVPHAGGRIPHGDTGCIEQARVGVADRVPAHPGLVEVSEGVDEGFPGAPVIALDGAGQPIKDHPGARGQWHYTLTRPRLRRVDAPVPGAGSPDVQDMAVYVAWLYGDGLAPPQAGEEDELGHAAPDPWHSRDHRLDFGDGQFMSAVLRLGNPWSADGER